MPITIEMVGLPAFLVLTGAVTFYTLLLKGSIRLGREYDEMKVERDWWRSRAERGTRMAEQATSLADRVLPPASEAG